MVGLSWCFLDRNLFVYCSICLVTEYGPSRWVRGMIAGQRAGVIVADLLAMFGSLSMPDFP